MSSPRWFQPAGACLLLAAAALFALATPAHADKGKLRTSGPKAVPTAYQSISGNPLTIAVGEDQSFQIHNATIPGTGQFYPPGNTGPADFGWFVLDGSTLYNPDFTSHDGGSAAGSFDTVYTFDGQSGVSGTGSATDPYRVTTTTSLGSSGLVATGTASYVNGEDFLRQVLTLTNNSGTSKDLKVFLGGDIYLAGADEGVPYRDAASAAVGGQDCSAAPSYYVLMVPQTAPSRYSAVGWSSIWSQIRSSHELDNNVGTSCTDNGSALQWNLSLAAGASTTIQTATSFGSIPSILSFNIYGVTPNQGAPGSTVNVSISGLGFQPGTTFDFGAGITIGNLVIIDANTATATLNITAGAVPGWRDVHGLQEPGGLTATLPNGFEVTSGSGPGPVPGAPPTTVPMNNPLALGGLGLLLLLLGGIYLRTRPH